jgi:hypothetical protein
VLAAHWCPADAHFDKLNVEWRAWIAHDQQRPANSCYLNVEFFAKLALCRIQITLTGFELSPWKLPQSAVPLMRWPATDQILPTPMDHSSEYADRHFIAMNLCSTIPWGFT